jgi:hypothetical protein
MLARAETLKQFAILVFIFGLIPLYLAALNIAIDYQAAFGEQRTTVISARMDGLNVKSKSGKSKSGKWSTLIFFTTPAGQIYRCESKYCRYDGYEGDFGRRDALIEVTESDKIVGLKLGHDIKFTPEQFVEDARRAIKLALAMIVLGMLLLYSSYRLYKSKPAELPVS